LDPYEALANAIIQQAAKDYMDALRKLKRNPKHRESLATAKECEEFFRSDWFHALTKVDSEYLLQRMQKEALHDC